MGVQKYEFQKIRQELLAETKQKISESVGKDYLISQAIAAIGELDKVINALTTRLREWYGLYNPELSHKHTDYEYFVSAVIEDSQKTTEMGGVLTTEDREQLVRYAKKIQSLIIEKQELTAYIESVMKTYCPHIQEIAGTLIGAKLIAQKGTLKELAFMPASTIQLLGAEKALFRHLKSKSRSPKYGYIMHHPTVASAQNKGKAARQLANKIAKAAKQDYFHDTAK